MKIGILARGLSESVGGAKQFIADLINGLAEVDRRNEYIVFYDSDRSRLGLEAFNFKEIVVPCRSKLLFDHVIFPYWVHKIKPDLVYCPKHVIPLLVRKKSVITIYDALYFPIPGKIRLNEYRFLDTLYMRIFMPLSIRRAAHVHTISQNTKSDLKMLFTIPDDHISVAYPGLSDFALHPLGSRSAEQILADLGIPAPYIFYAGTLSYRKNVATLFRVFAMLQSQIPHHLVVTGGGPEKSIACGALLKQYNIEDRVRVLGTVDQITLKALFQKADFFVFPSRYEGFGLPVIEAMALGCPVICSNAASLPEAAGDAAMMFDPDSDEALAAAMLKMASDPALKSELVKKGVERARIFSYQRTARQMMSIFENALYA